MIWTRIWSDWVHKKIPIKLPPGIKTKRVSFNSLSVEDKKIFKRILKRHPNDILIWLMDGVRAFDKNSLLEATSMVDATRIEKESMVSALKPLGEYVGTIGMQRPLADYSKDEVLGLIEVAITAYQDYYLKQPIRDDEIPF